MAAFGVFGLCQIHAFVDYLRSKLNTQQFEILFKSVISLVGFILLSVGAVLMLTGKVHLHRHMAADKYKTFLETLPCCIFVLLHFGLSYFVLGLPQVKYLHGLVVSTPCWTPPMPKTTSPSSPRSLSTSPLPGPPTILTCSCWFSCFQVSL